MKYALRDVLPAILYRQWTFCYFRIHLTFNYDKTLESISYIIHSTLRKYSPWKKAPMMSAPRRKSPVRGALLVDSELAASPVWTARRAGCHRHR